MRSRVLLFLVLPTVFWLVHIPPANALQGELENNGHRVERSPLFRRSLTPLGPIGADSEAIEPIGV